MPTYQSGQGHGDDSSATRRESTVAQLSYPVVRMSTKLALTLICVAGTLSAFVPILAAFATLGLLTYAARREQTTKAKSERVSPTAAALVFCGIGLCVAFCFTEF